MERTQNAATATQIESQSKLVGNRIGAVETDVEVGTGSLQVVALKGDAYAHIEAFQAVMLCKGLGIDNQCYCKKKYFFHCFDLL